MRAPRRKILPFLRRGRGKPGKEGAEKGGSRPESAGRKSSGGSPAWKQNAKTAEQPVYGIDQAVEDKELEGPTVEEKQVQGLLPGEKPGGKDELAPQTPKEGHSPSGYDQDRDEKDDGGEEHPSDASRGEEKGPCVRIRVEKDIEEVSCLDIHKDKSDQKGRPGNGGGKGIEEAGPSSSLSFTA